MASASQPIPGHAGLCKPAYSRTCWSLQATLFPWHAGLCKPAHPGEALLATLGIQGFSVCLFVHNPLCCWLIHFTLCDNTILVLELYYFYFIEISDKGMSSLKCRNELSCAYLIHTMRFLTHPSRFMPPCLLTTIEVMGIWHTFRDTWLNPYPSKSSHSL